MADIFLKASVFIWINDTAMSAVMYQYIMACNHINITVKCLINGNTNSQMLIVSRLVLQFSLPNPLQPVV